MPCKRKIVSKLDLSYAYMQLALDRVQEIRYYFHSKRALQYTRLLFGISLALAIFQRTMGRVLHDIWKCWRKFCPS